MQARMKYPLAIVPGAMQALQAFSHSAENRNVPNVTLYLIQLRASQINGCSVCVAMHSSELKQAGESDDRIATVAAWRDAPWFTDAERAALALAEALTRISDRPDGVSDEVWDEAARHYDEQRLAVLIVAIVSINVWNRINVAVRQVAGAWASQAA
ncbi:MAG TPA: carboxymuconolactone decarboxylase family protein [Devosiaceae bacterium]|jgi:AhpD family alkylhydroperoxidase